ncbi:hypothetical protein [Streptomyces sp. bgisy126]|uniref:hypothetical protein n=1 Tax=unclassified Streptomyces TaxID=2593676 RepID=UPI003EC1428A
MEREPSLPAPQAVRVIRTPLPRPRAVEAPTTALPLFPPLFAAIRFPYARERGGRSFSEPLGRRSGPPRRPDGPSRDARTG